jgi:non-heme chloroperoxidase
LRVHQATAFKRDYPEGAMTRYQASGALERRMAEIWHPHLVLWGEKDGWIAPADLKTMAAAMPDCRLITVPGIGHSMNLESPALYAGYFGAWFGALPESEVAI